MTYARIGNRCPACGVRHEGSAKRYCTPCTDSGAKSRRQRELRRRRDLPRREHDRAVRFQRQLAAARSIAELWFKSCDAELARRLAAKHRVTRRALDLARYTLERQFELGEVGP